MAVGSVTNAWRRDLWPRSASFWPRFVSSRACQAPRRLFWRKIWRSSMGRDRQAVAGSQTDLALWRRAWRKRYRQLQPLSIGWIRIDAEAMRNVIRQGNRVRSRFRAQHPRTLRLDDNDRKISIDLVLYCNISMVVLRSKPWRSRQPLVSSKHRSGAPPPAELRVSGDPFLLPGGA